MPQRRPGKVRVAILFGGQSDEHDVSLRSAETVIGALDPDRFEVIPIGVTRDGRWLTGGDPMRALMASSPFFALEDEVATAPAGDGAATSPSGALAEMGGAIDVVFPVLHGPMGEDGTVQGLLELSGLAYVGSGVLGSAVAMDKAMAKTVLAEAGLPQVPWRLVQRSEWERDPDMVTASVAEALGFPCFVKPANMGSSVGVAKAHSAAEFPAAMTTAAAYDRRIIVERGVDARELEMSILGNEEPIASIAGEVIAGNEFYDYNAKYVDDDSQIIIPADIDRETMFSMQRSAIDAFRALDLAGLARVDFFLERDTSTVYVNEVNTIPGFTSISMYPKLWEASGIPLPELVERLLRLAQERHGQRRR